MSSYILWAVVARFRLPGIANKDGLLVPADDADITYVPTLAGFRVSWKKWCCCLPKGKDRLITVI